MLFGGSGSGKTTVLVMAVIYRVLHFAGSRHLICRYRAKDVCSSVLGETLLPWLENTVGKRGYTYPAYESMVTFFSGSEIRMAVWETGNKRTRCLGTNTTRFTLTR